MRRETYILFAILLSFSSLLMSQESNVYEIEKLAISSRLYNDMSPSLYGDTIVFCSDRRISALKDVRTFDRTLLYNLYFALRKDSTDWENAKVFSKNLSPLVNEGPFSFSPDGKQIYYTSNVKQGKEAKKTGIKNNMGIFIADADGGDWSNIRPFKYNDPLWNVAHPSISKDGKYLFFAADIPGGEGGSDIWYCEWVNGEWSDPVNPGPAINSAKSDLYPWFNQSGELYYASSRSGGVGGLDIYVSSLRFGQWKKAVLLPEPINSGADDFSYIMEDGLPNGYFTSNRSRNDDIYRFSSLIIRKNNCNTQVADQFCYEFSETNAQKFDSMPYDYQWDFGDGKTAMGVVSEHCFEEPGSYIVKLNVVDKVTNDIQYNEVSYLLDIERTIQPYIISNDTCSVSEEITFDAGMSNLPGWNITTYYWNFDDGTIGSGITCNKSFTLPGKYIVQLIVTAAPDQDGNTREACVSKYIVVEQNQ